AAIQETRKAETALVTRFILNQVFTRPRLMRLLMAGARLLRDSGLAGVALEAELVGGRLKLALALLVSTRPQSAIAQAPRTEPQAAESVCQPKKTARVAMLSGCVMEGLFGPTNRATERVLERNGCEIVSCPEQGCCGALHAHAGQIEMARRLARRN